MNSYNIKIFSIVFLMVVLTTFASSQGLVIPSSGGSVNITQNITNIFQNITIIGNTTNHSNSTDYWITNIGALDDVSTIQFNNNGGTLTLDESWLTSFINAGWCALTGCNMTGNLNTTGNITAGTFTGTFVGDGSGLTGVASSGDSTNNSFHIFINGSAYNNINHNITAGDIDDVEFVIEPGKKFIFGETFT